MAYIKIEDGVFAEEATPDPSRVFSVEGLQQELDMKQQEVVMCDEEITTATERKTKLEEQISEIEALLAE